MIFPHPTVWQRLVANLPLLFVSIGLSGVVMGFVDRPNRRRWWGMFGIAALVMLLFVMVMAFGLLGLAA